MLARLIICHLIDHFRLSPARFTYFNRSAEMSLSMQTYKTTKYREYAFFKCDKIMIIIDGRSNTVTFLKHGKNIAVISVYDDDSIKRIEEVFGGSY